MAVCYHTSKSYVSFLFQVNIVLNRVWNERQMVGVWSLNQLNVLTTVSDTISVVSLRTEILKRYMIYVLFYVNTGGEKVS